MANRGKITELVVYNFKSFAGKHVVGPFLEFTAVVGPNGGGKSNIMDAVSFVLGVKSSDLRASNLKELVYRKESEKSNETNRSCYVKLRFTSPPDLPLNFKRTISSSGSSDYYINKCRQSSENYQRTLQDLSILVNAKNFLIFQGQVDSLAMKSGRDLTALFEKISGSDELKQEYDASKNEVDVCEENLKSVNTKISFLASEKRKLKEQKAQSVNYDNIVNKIKELQFTYYLLQFSGIERELERKIKIIESKAQDLDNLRRGKENCILELRECNITLKQTEQKLINITDDGTGKINLSRNKKSELLKLQENIKQFDNRIIAKMENQEKVKQELEKESKRYSNLHEEQQIFEDEIRNKQKLLEEELRISISDSKKAVFFQLKKELGIKAFAEKKELERAQKELSTKEINISLISQQLKTRQSDKKLLDEEIDSLQKSLQSKTDEKQKTEICRTKAISDLSIASQEHEHLKAKESENLKKLESLDSKIREYKVVETCKIDKEKERSVIDDMIRHRKGVKGLLGDLLTPIQPKYATAINACLGGILNYLVVDDVDVAQYVHQKLRDHNIIKEILVLDNVPENRISESLRHLVSKYGCLLLDVVNFERTYGMDKAMTLLVGNKALADGLDNANNLRQIRGIKMVVTIDGICIKNGMISSAPTNKKFGRVSQKKVQIEKEAEEIRNEVGRIQRVLQGENTVGNIRQNIETYTSLMNSLENDIGILKMHLDGLVGKRKEIIDTVSKLEQQVNILISQSSHVKKTVSLLEDSIQAIEEATFKDFCREMGIPSIRLLEGRDLDEENKIQTAINSLKKESIRISWMLKAINLQSLNESLSRVQESITKDAQEVEKMKARQQTLTHEYEKLSEISTMLKEQEKFLKEEIRVQKELQESLQQKYDAIVKNCTKAEKENSNDERDLEHLNQQKRQKIEELFVKNLDIPMVVYNNQRNVDFSKLDKKYMRLSPSDIEKESEEISKSIEKESKNLEQLVAQGKCSFNQEKFVELESKLEDSNKQMECFDRLSKEAKAKFLRIKEDRRGLFMKTFDLVANNISRIYKEMTKTSKNFYYGGNSLLYVNDTEEPYNGGVIYSPTPPGKRCMYEMDQLSGGEKTIAALSLLFAIHSAMPSPFYIMDEVDAFLDWENCQLLLNYLQKVSEEQSQCIIITHKEEFFSNADNLIGTTFIPSESTSRSYSFDLRPFGAKQMAIV